MRTIAAIVICFWATAAGAQNCSNAKFGADAERKPQNTSRDILGQSLDDIVEQGWMSFAVYENFPPFVFEKDGSIQGIDIDVGHLIADKLGVKAHFNVVSADENVDADLRNNVWRGAIVNGKVANVMLHVPYDRELACRNEQVVFTGQYFNEKIGIAYRKDAYEDGGPVPAYFRFDKVGVENDSISDFYLSGIANGQVIPNMTRYHDTIAAMEGLEKSEVVAVMGPQSQLEFARDDQVDIHTPPLAGLARSTWTLGVGIRQNWRPLAYAVDDVIRAAVEDGDMEKIFAKYSVSYNPPDW